MDETTGTANKANSESLQIRKNWEDITTEEKIERMRDIIKSQARQLSDVQTALYNLRINIKRHIHLDNKVMIAKEALEYDDSKFNGGLTGVANLSQDKFF